ncbi:MAG: DUF3105 domain-containing protein [Chloroflexi bacterium]|nr:DUF3105 domain-containing protein [Chloroflexota bacterium]
MNRHRWLVGLVALVATLLVACGGSGASTAIRETTEDFFRALAVDPPRAYTHLSQECQREFSFLEFASGTIFISSLLGESEPSIENLRVLRSDGDEVEAQFDIVVYVDGQTVSIVRAEDSSPSRFVKEDGRWRFASCKDFGLNLIVTEDSRIEPVADEEPVQSSRSEAVAAEADDDPALAGTYVDLPAIYGGYYGNPDGPHTAAHTRSVVDYESQGNSNPPAGGPHWGNGACGSSPADSPPFCGPVAWGVYRSEWDAESLVHSMEHGGVIVWFNTIDRDIVEDLESIVSSRLAAGDLIVLAPYLLMEDEHIAITSWSRIDKFPVGDYSSERVNAFLDDHVRRFNPEDF